MSSPRLLFGACTSGLGDRLLSLAGCQRVAERTNRQLILYWQVSDRCGCPFERLFDNVISQVTEADLHRLLFTNYTVKVYNAWLDRPGLVYNKVAADGDPSTDIVVIKSWNYPVLENDRDGGQLHAELRTYLTRLRPVPEIQRTADGFDLPDQAIGVHIRRGDAIERFGVSREEHFAVLMKAVLAWDPGRRFFLATDDNAVERRFVDQFGDRIVAFPKRGGGRSEERGMAESLVDLLLLSRTQSILGNQHSAFSRLAAIWGNRRLVLAGEENATTHLGRSVACLLGAEPERKVRRTGRPGLPTRDRNERAIRELAAWRRTGRPPPPPNSYKHWTVLTYGRRYHLGRFIETGTYRGDMVGAVLGQFEQIISIELGHGLFEAARARFVGCPNVTLLEGDSTDRLPEVLAKLGAPALFWLDAHYSWGVTACGRKHTPILDEVSLILAHPVRNHVILVDDVRLFGHEAGYPTLEQVKALVRRRFPGALMEERHDILRIQLA